MTISFVQRAWEDYVYWQQNDTDMVKRINALLKDITRDPFRGIGKPEPLRGNFAGYWSRRITDEHRLVYRVAGAAPNQELRIVQARFHYD